MVLIWRVKAAIVGLQLPIGRQKGIVDHQNGVVAHQRTRAGGPEHRAHRGGHALVYALGGDFRVLDGGIGAHPMHDRATLAVDQYPDQRGTAALDVVEFVVEAGGRLLGDLTVEADRGRLSLSDFTYDIFQLGSFHSSVLPKDRSEATIGFMLNFISQSRNGLTGQGI